MPNESTLAQSQSRRTFLHQSAAVAGALSTTSILQGAEATPNEKINIGLIGCGGQGNTDLSEFLANGEVNCSVVCDVDESQTNRAAKTVEGARGKRPEMVKDFRRVLDRKDIDAVIIATPDHWHAIPTVLACQAEKDIYVEKPLATSIAEGRAMLTAAEKHNRVVQMGTQWRSGLHWAEAVDIVRSGKLGKVSIVRGWAHLDWLGDVGHPANGMPPNGVDYDMWLGPAPKRDFNKNRFHFNFRWFWDYAGGLMTDWGVHLINVMLWAMGPEFPTSVSATGGKFVLDDNSETPDTQIALYEFPDYTLMWEHKVGNAVGINGHAWGISWTGSEGTLIARDDGWQIIPEPKKKSLEAKKAPGQGASRPLHIRNFLDCMKSREAPVENLEVGHHVSTVAHLGNIALRSGSKIVWDAENEKIIGNEAADRLVGVDYRQPWTLPYYPRS